MLGSPVPINRRCSSRVRNRGCCWRGWALNPPGKAGSCICHCIASDIGPCSRRCAVWRRCHGLNSTDPISVAANAALRKPSAQLRCHAHRSEHIRPSSGRAFRGVQLPGAVRARGRQGVRGRPQPRRRQRDQRHQRGRGRGVPGRTRPTSRKRTASRRWSMRVWPRSAGSTFWSTTSASRGSGTSSRPRNRLGPDRPRLRAPGARSLSPGDRSASTSVRKPPGRAPNERRPSGRTRWKRRSSQRQALGEVQALRRCANSSLGADVGRRGSAKAGLRLRGSSARRA